jgi:hypothetical protein
MCPTADGFEFVSEVHWNSTYYGAMAAAAAATESVQKKATEIAFPLRLWNLARKIRDLADLVENPHKVKPAPAAERVDVHKALEQFDVMLKAVDDFYEGCRRSGRTNQTLTAASLSSIHRHNETIRDFTERVKLTIDPQTDEIFRRAREARETRGTVPMSSVF